MASIKLWKAPSSGAARSVAVLIASIVVMTGAQIDRASADSGDATLTSVLECALESGQTFAGVDERNEKVTVEGKTGLAPSWAEGQIPTEFELEVVAACTEKTVGRDLTFELLDAGWELDPNSPFGPAGLEYRSSRYFGSLFDGTTTLSIRDGAAPAESSEPSNRIPFDLRSGHSAACGDTGQAGPSPTVEQNAIMWKTAGVPGTECRSWVLEPLGGQVRHSPALLRRADGRLLTFTAGVRGNGGDADGTTMLEVATTVDGKPARFARHATGSGTVSIALPHGDFSDEAVTITFRALDTGRPLEFIVEDLALTTVAAQARLPKEVVHRPGDYHASDQPRPVQVVIDVMFSCDFDVLKAPSRIGVRLHGQSLYATHTRTLTYVGPIRQVERYQLVADLSPGIYEINEGRFFEADFEARMWGSGRLFSESGSSTRTSYKMTRACQEGVRPAGSSSEGLFHPNRPLMTAHYAVLPPRGERLVLQPGVIDGPTPELPPDASLPLPRPICPEEGCA